MTTNAQQLEQHFDDLGIDIDLEQATEVEVDRGAKPDEVDLQTTEVTVYKSYDPDDPDAETRNYTENVLLNSGDQMTVHVFRRPECPSCGYIPTEEGEPGHLTGECIECGTQTCPRCKNICNACGKILCNSHTEGHGVVDETYCSEHASQVEKQLEFERKEERLQRKFEHQLEQERLNEEQRRKQKKLRFEEERKRIKQTMEKRKLRFNERLKAKELEMKIVQEKLRDRRERERLREQRSVHPAVARQNQARRASQSLRNRRGSHE